MWLKMSVLSRENLSLGIDQVLHKLSYITQEDGRRRQISDLERRGLLLSSENKGTDQLHGYRAADLGLCFLICKKNRFYHDKV